MSGFRMLKHSEITPRHEAGIFNLANSWWREISAIPLDYSSFQELVSKRPGNVWVNEYDEVIAYYLLIKINHPFNKNYKVGDIVSIVINPKYRGTTLFFRMWNKIKDDCKDVDEIHLNATLINPMPYIKKLGFEEKGTSYIRRM